MKKYRGHIEGVYSYLKYSSLDRLQKDITKISNEGYKHIIIYFNDVNTLKKFVKNELAKIEKKSYQLILRMDLINEEVKGDSKYARKILRKASSIKNSIETPFIISVDEEIAELLNPNILQYYNVRLISLRNFRWKTLKRYYSHKVYFEVLLDSIFTSKETMKSVIPKIAALEKIGRLIFSQEKPIVKYWEIPYITSVLTDKRSSSYGPVTRWGEIIWLNT